MEYSDFRFIRNHRTPCKYCQWCSWQVVRKKNRGGTWQYQYQCQNCGWLVPRYLKKTDVERAGIDAITVGINGDRHKCEVCGNDGAENHHWAPWAIFGEEAEKWPQSYLCQPCHTRWHQLVTPNISHNPPV